MTKEEYIDAMRKLGYEDKEINDNLELLEKLRLQGINLSYEEDFKFHKECYIEKPIQ